MCYAFIDMSIELYKCIEESIDIVNKLIDKEERDKDSLSESLKGDLLMEYVKASNTSLEVLKKMKQKLCVLLQNVKISE